MCGIIFLVFSIVVMLGEVRGNTGTPNHKFQSCELKCDMVQEVTLLRQLLNQESLLRINSNNELQELKKALADIKRDTQQINASFEQRATSVETRLTTAESAITSEQNENKITKLEITSLEKEMGKMNQTIIKGNNFFFLNLLYIMYIYRDHHFCFLPRFSTVD